MIFAKQLCHAITTVITVNVFIDFLGVPPRDIVQYRITHRAAC